MHPVYWIFRTFFLVTFTILHRFRVYGKEHLPTGGAIIASNHASFIDPPIIGAACNEELWYIARDSLFRYPMFRFMITSLNAYPVTGSNADRKTLRIIGYKLKEHKKAVIFPEGERTWDGKMLPFKTGIGMLAFRYNVPIIPTYIHGSYAVWNRTHRFPLPWGKLACVFGTPIYPKDFAEMDKKEAQERITAQLEESVKKLRDWYLAGAKGTPP